MYSKNQAIRFADDFTNSVLSPKDRLQTKFGYRLPSGLLGAYIQFYNNERIQLKTKLTPLEKRCQFVA